MKETELFLAFPVYFWLGTLRIHPHILFESLAYTIAFRLLLRNVRKDAIMPSQRSAVMLGGMLGAFSSPTPHTRPNGAGQSTGDVFVYPLIVGTAIGRIGCFLTGLSDRTCLLSQHFAIVLFQSTRGFVGANGRSPLRLGNYSNVCRKRLDVFDERRRVNKKHRDVCHKRRNVFYECRSLNNKPRDIDNKRLDIFYECRDVCNQEDGTATFKRLNMASRACIARSSSNGLSVMGC